MHSVGIVYIVAIDVCGFELIHYPTKLPTHFKIYI